MNLSDRMFHDEIAWKQSIYVEDIKESIKEFNNKIHEKGMRNGLIQTAWVYDIVKEVFGDALCVNSEVEEKDGS